MASEHATLYRDAHDPANAVTALLEGAGMVKKSDYVYQTDEFQWAFGQDPNTGALVMGVATLDGQTGLFRSRPA